jgi:ParB-like chromosome segregation protein Spo0J
MEREMQIYQIPVHKRFREKLGDLEELAASIREVGLLQSIGVTPEHVLVFGERRLRACRDILRWTSIPTRIVEVKAMLNGQIDENCLREDYTVSERVAIADALRNFSHGGDRRSKQARTRELESLTVDKPAKRAGLESKDTYIRAKNVLRNGIPELVQAMDQDDIPIAVAARIAELPPQDQRHSIRQGRRAIERAHHDHYPTPAWATEALLERETFGKSVWEPACGQGAMSEVLKRAGYQVRSSDLIDRGYGEVEDFLQSHYIAQSIVTNPPFKLAEAFVKKALQQATYKVAHFLPLTFLEGARRYSLLSESPLKTLYVFSTRVNLYKIADANNGNGRAAFAWYAWKTNYRGRPTIEWIADKPKHPSQQQDESAA